MLIRKDFLRLIIYWVRHFLSERICLNPWDGSMNMVGNDRYSSFVKLVPGADISQLKEQIPRFINTYLPVEKLKEAGVELQFDFQPITAERENDENIQSMIYMLSLIAFALIFVAMMNYILITVSSVIGRSKEVAVRKCYGASTGNINGIIFAEAFVHVVIALIVAVLILFTFQDFISQLLGTPIERLLMSRSMLAVLGVSAGVLLVTGLLPGSLYARIPVAAAFRNYRESKRLWKIALLFVQLTAAIFLVILLFVVNRQYHRMTNDDPGYAYDFAQRNPDVYVLEIVYPRPVYEYGVGSAFLEVMHFP